MPGTGERALGEEPFSGELPAGVADARVSKTLAEALVSSTAAARLSKSLAEVALRVSPNAQLSKLLVEVLYTTTVTQAGVWYWTGTTRQPATIKGWWDGTTLRALTPVTSWVDGSGVKHPLRGP